MCNIRESWENSLLFKNYDKIYKLVESDGTYYDNTASDIRTYVRTYV